MINLKRINWKGLCCIVSSAMSLLYFIPFDNNRHLAIKGISMESEMFAFSIITFITILVSSLLKGREKHREAATMVLAASTFLSMIVFMILTFIYAFIIFDLMSAVS